MWGVRLAITTPLSRQADAQLEQHLDLGILVS